MPAKRSGLPVHGWVVIDKASGPSSAAVTAQVRGMLNARKAGHGGTLDPAAEGVLPVALGEATKTVAHILDARKAYRFTVRWGIATDTHDAAGRVTARDAARPAPAAIAAVLPRFTGAIMQAPPAFSALKVDGARAHALARAGRPPVLPPRPATVHALALAAAPDPDHAVFEVACDKGFYVRALARDLAGALNCAGHVAALRRTRAGPFAEDHAISLAELAETAHNPARLAACLLPVQAALDGIPALPVTDEEATRLRAGRAVPLWRPMDAARRALLPRGGMAVAVGRGQAVAMVRGAPGVARPVRVFRYT